MKEDNNHFWASDSGYDQFAITIPSDIPAYSVVHNLLNPRGKNILDFGCHHGKSSKRILEAGASSVTGVDNIENNIEHARQKFHRISRLKFIHVPANIPIIHDQKFDAAAMTFVHPTISNRDELSFTLEKISDALTTQGRLLILGLHPESFSPRKQFLYYGHQPPEKMVDGAPFRNQLKLRNGQHLEFTDYFWPTETIVHLLQDARFKIIQIFNLGQQLTDSPGRTMNEMIESLNDDWKDEWTAPLYQVIEAIK